MADLEDLERLARSSLTDPAQAGAILLSAGQILALLEERKKLRAALEFYMNPQVYRPSPHGSAFSDPDLSFVARAALEGEKP